MNHQGKTTPFVKIERYKQSRFWAVWVGGELLAVVCYKRGALAIKDLVLESRKGKDSQHQDQEDNMVLFNVQQTIGREGILRVNELEISVIILDVRLHPKMVDYLIEPTAGRGKVWIDADEVRIVE